MDIVKIGGSLITDKGVYRKFFKKKASLVLDKIVDLKDVVIVHGGGSFGHYMCKKYGLPGEASKERVNAMSIVKYDMENLNQRIVKMLIERGKYAVGISPFFLRNKEEFNYDIVGDLLNRNITPVLYGDVYMSHNNIGVLSGDHIMMSLAQKLKPHRAIFLSDVDGVYNKDPKKYHDARLIRDYKSGDLSFEPIKKDVTGGMELKFKSMVHCRDLGVKTYLINGNYPERILQIGKNEFVGTEFT
jgi:isopentenyl phosphate kinase